MHLLMRMSNMRRDGEPPAGWLRMSGCQPVGQYIEYILIASQAHGATLQVIHLSVTHITCVPTLQGKLHDTLEDHLGQLAAEIRSAREQYKRVYLSKRKHEDEGDFIKVGTAV